MEMLTYAYRIDVFNETPNIPNDISAQKTKRYLPFDATSCSSPFRNSGLALNPFHQFAKEAFEGEVEETEGGKFVGDSAGRRGCVEDVSCCGRDCDCCGNCCCCCCCDCSELDCGRGGLCGGETGAAMEFSGIELIPS